MLAGLTVFLTILAALGIGILCGFGVTNLFVTIFLARGIAKPHPQVAGKTQTAAV